MLKNNNYNRGSFTIIIAVVMLSMMIVISIMSVRYARTEQKTYANDLQSIQVFEAAEAGLEYAKNYLQVNRNTIITDTDNNGYINENSTTITLPEGLSATFVYSNPIKDNFTYIKIVSTGKSSDGSSTRTVSNVINVVQWIAYVPDVSLTTGKSVILSGSTTITNTASNTTVWSGDGVSLTGASKTSLGQGTASSAKKSGNDIITNDSSLSSLSVDDFYNNFFGLSKDQLKSHADIIATDGNALDGITGKLIWLENASGTVNLAGTSVIGSVEKPVVLVVNGNLALTGNVTLYGVLYIGGDIANTGGNFNVQGSVLAYGSAAFSGNSSVDSSVDIFNVIKKQGLYSTLMSGWNDIGY